MKLHFSLAFCRLRIFYDCIIGEEEDKTRFPGFLCPDYAGFLSMTENHFFDALTNVLEGPDLECRYVIFF